MEKVRNSDFLKILSYILIPILVEIIIFSLCHIIYLSELNVPKKETKYSQTENFANEYIVFLSNKIVQCQNIEQYENFIKLEDEHGNPYYYTNMKNDINYIIIDKETKEMYTNIRSSNYQQIIDNIKNQKIYWNNVNNIIETNIEYLNQDNIKYNHYYSNKQFKEQETKQLQNYDIYSFVDEEQTEISITNIYDFMLQNRELPIYVITISTILLGVIAIYLLWAIGHKEGKNVTLGVIDKIPFELICIICFSIIYISLEILYSYMNFDRYIIISLIVSNISYLLGYSACAIFTVTMIKRIKANKFFESFLIYKFISWIYKKLQRFINEIKNKTPLTKKIFWLYWGFVAINLIFANSISIFSIAIPLLIIFWTWVYYKIRTYIRNQEEIKDNLKQIYEGKTNVYVDDTQLRGIYKEMAIYINDISNGFTNSIEESLKAERLKTELITNVSHDIKTPLTSIINYIDILKNEDIQNEKVKEYIEIIDEKSQKLKKLTEDVIEASKASSGNIKLNIEKINLKELLNQTIGEFKDKFEERNLKIETTIPESEIKINADSRYMYRIIENIFSNITKYAQENSRVYIDVKDKKGKIEISIKNISKDKLNISSDELMQRFVRGDKSRYTDGSGLGLSIAKSLTELQKGTFDIIIDGDLFKVIIVI